MFHAFFSGFGYKTIVVSYIVYAVVGCDCTEGAPDGGNGFCRAAETHFTANDFGVILVPLIVTNRPTAHHHVAVVRTA